MRINIDDRVVKRVETLIKKYKKETGKQIDVRVLKGEKNVTQEKIEECIKLMLKEDISLEKAYKKLYKTNER